MRSEADTMEPAQGREVHRLEIDRIFVRTSWVGFLRTLLAVPIYLLLTPYVLQKVGKELFGLWSINTIVTTGLMLVDFGFHNSLVHFTAAHLGEDDKLRTMFNTVFFFFLWSALGCLIVALCLQDVFIQDVLMVPPELHREGVFVFMTTVVGFCLRLVSMPYQALIEGHQRVDITQRVFLLWLLFNALATFMGLWISPSVYCLGIVSVLGNLVLFSLFYAGARGRYACARIKLRLFSMSTIRLMLPYSFWIQLASIFILLREPLLKTVVTRTYGLDNLASLEIAYRLTVQCMSFVTIPLLTALPVTSMLGKQSEELRRLVKKYLVWVILVLAVPVAVVYPASGPAVRFWLGEGFEDAALLLPWIFSAYALYYLTEPIYKTLQGLGVSWASAMVQGFYILTLGGGLFLWKDPQDLRTVAYPLLLASGVFSVANLVLYNRNIRSEAGV